MEMPLCRNRKFATFYGEDYCLAYEMCECDARQKSCERYVPETEEDGETIIVRVQQQGILSKEGERNV